MRTITLSKKAKAALRIRAPRKVMLHVRTLARSETLVNAKGRNQHEVQELIRRNPAKQGNALRKELKANEGKLIIGGRPGSQRKALNGGKCVTRHFIGPDAFKQGGQVTTKMRKQFIDKQGRIWSSEAAWKAWMKEIA